MESEPTPHQDRRRWARVDDVPQYEPMPDRATEPTVALSLSAVADLQDSLLVAMNDLKRLEGLLDHGMLLVRPDQVIAWRGPAAPEPATLWEKVARASTPHQNPRRSTSHTEPITAIQPSPWASKCGASRVSNAITLRALMFSSCRVSSTLCSQAFWSLRVP